ncbi:imidazolonepropionase [Sediminibacterium sp.]|uniref:imidazolonepropionase n=1 Tax=Sediminibacterium sp. TaxID=1917865 RepID=UPI002733946B|nr:imidazolonepropionase [Sediminibacterium sp.]MDP3393902.1 imidazolonepropionase [Sediminibacterium sp.]MDP3568767.1 imidazolonepropionase [Sediminibacterium sp.]
MKWVIQHIKQLVNTRTNSIVVRGAELSQLPIIDNAFIVVDNGIIQAYGSMHNLNAEHLHGAELIDAVGSSVLPCWCDSHTHLVYAASREEEFVHKINGLTYAEIAAKGGGILNSARKIAQATEAELYLQAMTRLQELMKLGTGAIEIKSGYGLNTENELKMLRVIKRIKASAPIPVKASFLGAHTYPLEFKENHNGYIDQIIHEMLPVIAKEQLADYIDVFCEEGFFSVAETQRICEAGKSYGLKAKIHANQLHASGGVELGVKLGAVSVDHLETMNDTAIQALGASNTIGTMLPTAAFFLRMPYQPARTLINANAALALASDYNPGSSPSGNMNFVVALSCIQMKMQPEEAINAATINGAFAMELQDEVGSITVGKRANLIFTQPIPSLAYLPYSFGSNLIEKVMINGRFI